MGLPPRTTGTFADSVEQLPDLAPVKPTQEALGPAPAIGEVFSAARTIQRGENLGGPANIERDGWAQLLEGLDLPRHQNPSVLWGSDDAHLQSWSALAGRAVDKATQERLILDAVRSARARNPKAFAGLPDTIDGIKKHWFDEALTKRRGAQDVAARAQGFSGTLANLAGSIAGSVESPEFVPSMAIGGVGGGTVAKIFARETLANGIAEAIVQPGIAQTREVYGEELTLGEAAGNVALSALFGGALEAGLTGAGRALSPVAQRAIDKIKAARDRAAAARSIGGAKLDPIDLFAELDNRELSALTRELVGDDKLSPDERAAIAALERDQEIGEASPFQPGPAGDGEHGKRLGEAINDLIDNRRPREQPAAPDAAAGARATGPERPPPGTSTPGARPQAVANLSAAVRFKDKVRHAESRGKADADNPRSSADGLFQITDGTFRSYHQRLFGTDPGAHPPKAVKNDPAKQEAIMTALTADNAARLAAIGEAATEGNLYLLHFAGEAGGARILRADPDVPIERLLDPKAITANPFLKGKSASQVIAWAHKQMGGSAASVGPRSIAGEIAAGGEDLADPRIAQLRKEALELDDQIVGLTRLSDGAPVNLYTRSVPASAIGVDATRFQFKAGGDEFGVTERLKGVGEWDAGLAGRVTLWEDEGGKLWIADGHQRHGLARRISAEAGADIRMDAMVLRARDGISAEEARVWAALKNIAEGTGSSIDAAKVLRDAGAGALDRLPPKSPLVRDGAALARLSDDAFGAVYNERIPADQAAVIGHLLPDNPDAHIGMVDLLIKVDPANRAQATSIVRQAIAAGFHKEEQLDLLGTSSTVTSLFLEKAKILERGLARLRKMRLVHKTAANEADELEAKGSTIARAASEKEAKANAEAAAIIDRLAYRAGPVADALTDAARDLAGGARLGDAADRFTARIRELDLRALNSGDDGGGVDLDGAGRESDAGEADPSLFEEPGDQGQPSLIELQAATERFSDPDGPAVKQQADSLVHDFKAAISSPIERWLARDVNDRVIGNFLSEAEAKTAAGKGGSVEHDPDGMARINRDQLIAASKRLGDNDDGDPVYEDPSGARFVMDSRHGGKPNWGGRVITTAEDMRDPLVSLEARARTVAEAPDSLLGERIDEINAVPEKDIARLIAAGGDAKAEELAANFWAGRPDLAGEAGRIERRAAAIAALAGQEKIGRIHFAEAISYEAALANDGAGLDIEGQVEQGLNAARAKAEELGVELQVEIEDEGRQIMLDDIRRGVAPKGSGAVVMRDLLAIADQHGARIFLNAEGNSPGLIRYYEGFGFKVAGAAESDTPMVREPAAPALDLGAAVDPAIAARQGQEVALQAAAPLRAAGDVDQLGEIGLGLFDAADQPEMKFRLGEEGEEISAAELLGELDDDEKAIDALRKCL